LEVHGLFSARSTRTARQPWALFCSTAGTCRRLHKDALAAWLVFQDALSQERGVAAIFERVGEYYRRHWFLPARFEPSAEKRGIYVAPPTPNTSLASHQHVRHDLFSEKIHLRWGLEEGLHVRGRSFPVDAMEAFQYRVLPIRFRQRRMRPTCLL